MTTPLCADTITLDVMTPNGELDEAQQDRLATAINEAVDQLRKDLSDTEIEIRTEF